MSAVFAEQPLTGNFRRLIGGHLTVAFVALALGGLFGLFQALNYAGISLYQVVNAAIPNPLQVSYYEGLTVHGVLLALVFTTFFICGFLTYVTARSLGMTELSRRVQWASWSVMLVGLVLAAVAILSNTASVLYTFYPPLKASPLFYIGLTLVVAGTWPISGDMAMSLRAWRQGHPGERTPLPAFMSVVTMIMWSIASIGIAAEMVFQLIPWSLGLLPGIDPELNRTLFWFTGHPIVYFWLLPAYVSWYTLVPRQMGGRLFSDPVARFGFLMFLAFSIPVGLHHQLEDPGVSQISKLIEVFFTFLVFFPSLLTAFSLVASFESVGWAHGDRFWFSWVRRTPWGDPSVAAQLLGMILFIFGGFGGLILASYNLNALVHNTVFVVGHFHTTVGSAVTLSFMGIAYWLVPYLAGRPLASRRMAQVQVWLWFAGMVIFSFTLHYLGLQGLPRRTDVSTMPATPSNWSSLFPLVALGGTILAISGVLFLLNLILTMVATKKAEQDVPQFAGCIHGPGETPGFLDRLSPWFVLTVILILIGYGPVFLQFIVHPGPPIPGKVVW
ncbi:MAG: cbb3-type cytochrome c oxidase subunit I [Chloroflexi bacterium]|nr:cbb3-type cytochrome c oxidase subunit I [Chloroflexota bacterium]